MTRNDKKQGGVGFLIHKKLKDNITEFHATSDRVASVAIKISKRYDIKIIQAYAPTSLSSQDALDEFYDDLRNALQRKKAHFNIIKGDFNAKVGNGDEDCVGPFGYGTRNERGDDLVNFATTNNFKITNTFYKKKQNRRWTWRSPDFETFNEIDYVLVDKSNIVKNTEVLNRVGIDSDH
ncbi:craniofacial development protein 2-like [Penaeus monodon]|uniref:craniofacial development protein 2-like n=1 Tax=Penaeus monodon TaxID=6687 RepID=UPI0018A765A9|nr:craniofacial development protein 2-like [Penaeus monodon]